MKTKDLLEFMRITHLLCIILVVITISSGRAQTGSPFITNIPLDKIGNALITDICSDEENVMIFTSNKSLFTYDGDLFSKIKTPAIPSLLFRDDQTAKIYVACYNSIGYIKKDSQCMYQFVSIADDTEDVFEILKAREKIFFIADKKIFVYDKASAKMTTIKSDKMLGFAWQSKETIYLQTSSNEILYLKDTAIKAWTGMLDEQILFATKQSEDKIILGTSKNKLYTFTDNSVQQLKIKDSLFLSENYIVDAIPYTENEIVISTDIGGAVLLNLQRGEIKQYMNYYTGLPDDEILAFGKDRDNGIWISHLQGISRVDFSVPIQCFSTYKGLEGNISDIIEYNKTLYVTTSEGVYKLERFEDVERKEVFKNVIKQVAVSTENNSKRLSFLRKRNKKTEYTTQMVRVAELSQAIRSVSYNYKRIKDISDKCHQIVAFDGGLVVGGNNGLYYIKNGKTEILIENTYIHTVSVSQFNPKQLYCGTNKGFFVINTNFASNVQIYIHHINTLKTKSIVSIVEQSENELWLGSENNAYKLTKENGGDWVIVPFGSQTIYQAVYGFIYDGKVFFYSDETVYEPNEETKELQESQNNFLTDIDLFYPNFNLPFVKKQGDYMFASSGAQITIDKYLHLFGEITRIIPQPDGRYWFVNNSKGIYHLNPKNEKAEEPLPLYLKYIRNRNIYIQSEEPIKLEFADNSLLFSFFSPYYLKTNDIKYSYRISGHDSIWSDWKKQGEIDIRFIPPGDYSLEVKAQNSLGVMGKSQIYTFSVLKPFTQTPLFYLLLLSCTAGFVVFTVKLRLRKLKNDKIILEQKIQKRTVTIEKQNKSLRFQHTEILQQKEEIEAQRDEIIEKKDIIEEQNNHVFESINYAQKIQIAVMPSFDANTDVFSEHFIFFKPRNIISGDFYWTKDLGDHIVIIAADCTGHGIPGAFMSMLGISLLNQIVVQDRITSPDIILNKLRDKVVSTFMQDDKADTRKDGMDVSLCVVDKRNQTIEFAGAYNSMLLFTDGELAEIGGNRMPVGIHPKMSELFTKQTFSIKKGMCFYLLSDGYTDQFGGPEGKKFRKKQLKELLSSIQTKKMDEQKQILENTYDLWKGNEDQVDDVLVIGVRI